MKITILLSILCAFFISSPSFANWHYSSSETISGIPLGTKVKKYKKTKYVPDDLVFFDEYSKPLYFEKYEGKTLLVVFWATWCSTCVKKMQDLDNLQKDFRKLPFEVLAISEDYLGVGAIKQFYQNYNLRHLAILHDYKNQMMQIMGINSLPTALIVDAEGKIIYEIIGPVNWHDDEVREMILEVIPGNPMLPKNSHKDLFLAF